MPLWLYRCRGCPRTLECFRKTENRNNPAYCSACAAWSCRRVITPPGLIGDTVVRVQEIQNPLCDGA